VPMERIREQDTTVTMLIDPFHRNHGDSCPCGRSVPVLWTGGWMELGMLFIHKSIDGWVCMERWMGVLI
jgi:hypothetical protein